VGGGAAAALHPLVDRNAARDRVRAGPLHRRRCPDHYRTILSEWLNVEIRRTWSYAAAMPVVPWLGTGLAPLLQWLVVPSLAFAITAQRYRRAR